VPKAIIYQVLKRLWNEGRFSSFGKASFDYIKSLGVSHIWYTGVVRHATGKPFVKGDPGCPYSISDYYDVNPYLADDAEKRMVEFRDLVARTHEAGLKVIIDFIPNHVSRDYSDSHGGIPTCGYCDYDWTDTDKIDYHAPGTWDRMHDIIFHWLDMGVDGFRCDMVELVPKDFFHWITGEVRKQYPETVFIAEVYNRDNYREFVDYAGFDLLYDKSGVYDILKSIVMHGSTAEALTWNWQFLGDKQENMLNFLENHDEVRLASREFAQSPGKGYSALAVAALFNTASFMLNFGQELGEDASNEANCRTSIFSWTTVNSFKSANLEVLSRYREVLHYAVLPAFASGQVHDLGYCSPFDRSKFFAWLRYDENDTYLVVASFYQEESDVTVRLPHSDTDVTVHVRPYDYSITRI